MDLFILYGPVTCSWGTDYIFSCVAFEVFMALHPTFFKYVNLLVLVLEMLPTDLKVTQKKET